MRWFVVHARDYKEYNDQLLSFAQHLIDRTGGALKVEFTYGGIGSGWRDRAVELNGYEQVLAGKFDMSQVGADTLGAGVVTLPEVLRNDDHAEAVWRGPVGQKLLAGISKRSKGKLEALAFSYSGGFRALVGTRAIHGEKEIAGANVLVHGEALAPDEQFLVELGATASHTDAEEFPDDRQQIGNTVDRIAGTLAFKRTELFSVEINGLAYVEDKYRPLGVEPLYVNLANHSMYATSMVANATFLASLRPDLHQVLVEETRAFALAERRLSAELALKNLGLFATK